MLRSTFNFLQLSGHPSILEFVAAAQMKIPSGGVEFMLLTELCSGENNVII